MGTRVYKLRYRGDQPPDAFYMLYVPEEDIEQAKYYHSNEPIRMHPLADKYPWSMTATEWLKTFHTSPEWELEEITFDDSDTENQEAQGVSHILGGSA